MTTDFQKYAVGGVKGLRLGHHFLCFIILTNTEKPYGAVISDKVCFVSILRMYPCVHP